MFFILLFPSILFYLILFNSNSYHTRHSVGNFLAVLKFYPSTKFSYCFTFDAPTVLNALPDL